MQLILGDVRLDLRQFPDLMSLWLRIFASEFLAATAALARLELLDVIPLVGGPQRTLVFFVAGLPAPFLVGLGLLRRRLGVRMLRAGRQRGVLGRFGVQLPTKVFHLRTQGRYLRQQQANDGLRFGRLTGDYFFRTLSVAKTITTLFELFLLGSYQRWSQPH